MASLTGDDGSEDVNDFLAHIRELGDKRDREDRERTQKLEEDIQKGRAERAARRAERARSISPTKDSPSSALSSSATQSVLATPTPRDSNMLPPQQDSAGISSPAVQEPTKPTPPPSSSLSRSNTLSWQQRPGSRGTTPTIRTRPLSMVAAENNRFRSPSATPEPSNSQEKEQTEPGENVMSPLGKRGTNSVQQTSPNQAAASMLANKDPNWFKQTADRGVGSAALRKSEESSEPDQLARTGSFRLHGLSRESTAEPEKHSGSIGSIRGRPHSMASPSYSQDALRLDPANAPDLNVERTPAMSPAQGRISPERSSRPASPTKGMGGFVQSAMLRRNDSVNKRWSAQAPEGLSRGNSVASNRGSRDLGQMTFTSPSTGGDREGNTLMENAVQDTPVRDKDGFVKPALPETPQESTTSRPGSPTKDSKRWSPVKSSWLENQINKTESPKPLKTATSQQPAWMADLKKTKAAKASVDLGRGFVSQAKSSPDKEKAALPEEEEELQPSSNVTALNAENVTETSVPEVTSPRASESSPVSKDAEILASPRVDTSLTESASPEQSSALSSAARTMPVISKRKPETPPKKDFRSNLKSRTAGNDKSASNEPEFKKAFGNLKRAETKNYKAPDTLKENIMRGKTGLAVSGGPQQTKRVDEFKESLLAKKKEFSAVPSAPLARNPSQLNEKPLPEALAKRTGMLNKNKSISEAPSGTLALSSPKPELKSTASLPESGQSATGTATAGAKAGGLAARFNPNLAGILARGPFPASGSSKPPGQAQVTSSGASTDVPTKAGPELTHQTKGRARGPKRKPPKSTQADLVEDRASSSNPALSYASPSDMPRETSTAKIDKYNQIKAGLVGDVGTLNALGISEAGSAKRTPTTSASASLDQARQSLVAEKTKPPGPRSPSTRVVSGSFSPKPSPKPADLVQTEPLATIADTSNKVNASMPTSTPTKKPETTQDKSELVAKAVASSQAKSPPTPGIKRVSTIAKPETPAKPSTPLKGTFTASPMQPAKNSRSPAVPSKSPSARNFTNSLESRAMGLIESDADTPAKRIVQNFFGFLPPPNKTRADIDTQAIINNSSRSIGKIKTLRKQIWELTSDGKRLPMPAQGEHIIYEDSMYLCTHVYGSAAGKHTTDAYLWIGDGVSPSASEDAQLFARNAAKEVGASGRPILLHQGKETSNFFDALGGIVIVRKGSSADASATYVLCVRNHLGQVAFDEVDYHAQSLCSGFPFIVSASGGRLYLWKGKGAGAGELGCARLIAMDLCLTGEVEEIDEGNEPEPFWEALRSKERSNTTGASHWHLKATRESFRTRLFAVDDARPRSAGLAAIQAVWNRRPSAPSSDDPSTADIREVTPYSQNDLAQDGIFILDAYFEVYVILGWRSSARFPAFRSALVFAQEYAILAASQEDRPFVPAAHVIFSGASAPYLKSAFRKWDDKRVTTQPVGSSDDTEMLPIHEALAAVTG